MSKQEIIEKLRMLSKEAERNPETETIAEIIDSVEIYILLNCEKELAKILRDNIIDKVLPCK